MLKVWLSCFGDNLYSLHMFTCRLYMINKKKHFHCVLLSLLHNLHEGHLHLLGKIIHDITVQVAKQPHQNSLETSPEKLQAGVRFFWNIAKLASVNANRSKKKKKKNHDFISRLSPLPDCYTRSLKSCTIRSIFVHYVHVLILHVPVVNTHTHTTRTHTHTHTHTVVSTPNRGLLYLTYKTRTCVLDTHTHTSKHPNRGLYLIH